MSVSRPTRRDYALWITSEDLYASLRKALIDRLRDKEAAVRAQAAAALAKLSFSEDTSELDDDETPLIEIVIEAMTYDTSA